MREPAVAAVDWGTTRMRVWLLGQQGEPLVEKRSDQGMLSAAATGFSKVLESALAELGAPDSLPAIIAGMAGARQGWLEAPYIDTPARLSDVLARAVPVPNAARPVHIIPGLAQRSVTYPDVMRGEETQIAGLAGIFDAGASVLCMPGTHSKWVAVEDGAVTGFGTWMTGELFSAIGRETVLKYSIGGGALVFRPGNPAFAAAVDTALEAPASVTSLLFGIRAGTLLLNRWPDDAAARLSGLLIGAEIAEAGKRFVSADNTVTLVASGLMHNLYSIALERAGITAVQADADAAVRAGLWAAARMSGLMGTLE